MNLKNYLGFKEQAMHYLDRPHQEVANQAVDSPAAWRSSELPPLEQVAYILSSAEVSEIKQAVAHAESLNKPTLELTRDDFPLPSLDEKFPLWRDTIHRGLGFQVIRGVPVDDWNKAQAELFFWCFGLHLGTPGLQNPEGHLLGHVNDLGVQGEDPTARLYKTASHINFHCDAADVVGLLCLKKAKAGGHSRIASSVTVFNDLVSSHPHLAKKLFDKRFVDNRDKEVNSPDGAIEVQPCCYADGTLRTFYHLDYFKSVPRHDAVEALTDEDHALFEMYEKIANDPKNCFDMSLEPGDIQLISNHTTLHARTEFEDDIDPDKRRHLLRLWLSIGL
ncbi:TauD/TfdA family dioxygenase [Shewanella gaetbuli]|uniref:TauD/TfdA family dioxygenase n=1 Tax=Shewanella gaetbuli TaxID=220752 RepID=A0A9X2CLB4_9GAMM|nr:TauD/TfdA family dioxygenase [Shewanella gaetbuli]MCL1142400.1 TauD/TfdA family dioxygenase [Shewanella gaetbuli]